MKKTISILLILAVCLAALTGCAKKPEPEHVLPPTRVGMEVYAPMLRTLDCKAAFEAADLIALVRIGDWLGEGSTDREALLTYYSAEPLKIYKGAAEGGLIVGQDGTSQLTYKGFPLFTYGDELLLFLVHGGNEKFEDFYWIAGTYAAVMYAAEDEAGALYYAGITEDLRRNSGIEDNLVHDPVKKQLIAGCPDVLTAYQIANTPFICREADMAAALAELAREQDG